MSRFSVAMLALWALTVPILGDAAFENRLSAARSALGEHRLAEAETLYRQLIDLYPHQVTPYQGLAEVFAAQERRDDALDLLLDVSRKLVRVSRQRDALAPLEQALRLDPRKADAHALLGRVLGRERRYREAATALERAVDLGADDLETLLYLAASYWETERLPHADAVYRRALDLHDNAFGALFHYGQFLLWRGRSGAAAAFLEEAAEKQPDRVDVLGFLGRARAAADDADGAIAAYERLLALEPENEKARYALDLLRRRKGTEKKDPSVETQDRAPLRNVVLTPIADEAGLRFQHDPGVTPARHLPETMGSGLAWLDYDGDGWQDLYLVQSGPFPPDGSPRAANRLFRNRGDGAGGRVTFEDVTERSGAGDRSYGQGATAADVDGDGDADLFVTNYGPDVLLLNRGDGTFEDASARTGLALDGWSSSAAFADSDGDGDLDLFVTGYVDYDPGHGVFCGDEESGAPDYCNVIFFPGADDAFFRQGRDGTFEEVTLAAGFENPAGRGLGVVFTDLDGDGRPDVYVANDLDPNRLYRNRGDGTFEDVSVLSGAAYNQEGKAEAGMGMAVGDVDGDERPEIAVTHFDTETNTLYRNLGGLQFEDASASSGFGVPSFNLLGFGIVLADLNRDGALDVYVANGHVFERPTRDTVERAQRDLLLLGDGRGRFRQQRLDDGPVRIGRGAAAADYDSDGDADVAVQHSGAAPELWRNDSAVVDVDWLGVGLLGRAPNRQAVGARVTLRTDQRCQVRWLLAGESYQSSGDRRAVFAWTSGEEVRELEIVWPSGQVRRLRTVPQGRYLRVSEEP